jgi:Spy/CpxP family protein refolding chaperone
MKRLLIIITIICSVGALAAQEPRRERTDGKLAQALQLTAAQQSAWENARQDFRVAVQPLLQQREQLARQVETAIADKSSDACTIGNLVINEFGLNAQIRSVRQTMIEKFSAVLTPDQKSKFDALESGEGATRERMMLEHQ